jgi:hypothetical protein
VIVFAQQSGCTALQTVLELKLCILLPLHTTIVTTTAVCLDGFESSDGKRALRLRLCGPGHYLHHKCILAVFAATGPKV